MRTSLLTCMLAASSFAAATTWNNVSLIDQQCSAKAKGSPDAHTRSCALQCAKSGFGILTADGKFLKFDQAGNDQALKLLQSSDKTDHIRVNVEGEQSNDSIAVKSVKF